MYIYSLTVVRKSLDRADNNHVTLDIICITQDMFLLVEAI